MKRTHQHYESNSELHEIVIHPNLQRPGAPIPGSHAPHHHAHYSSNQRNEIVVPAYSPGFYAPVPQMNLPHHVINNNTHVYEHSHTKK